MRCNDCIEFAADEQFVERPALGNGFDIDFIRQLQRQTLLAAGAIDAAIAIFELAEIDAVLVLQAAAAKAEREGPVTLASVKRALPGVGPVEVVTGMITFTPERNVDDKAIIVQRVVKGDLEFVERLPLDY